MDYQPGFRFPVFCFCSFVANVPTRCVCGGCVCVGCVCVCGGGGGGQRKFSAHCCYEKAKALLD